MKYPSFFNDVPVIRTYDPLAHFLGAVEDGIIEYTYLDVVKAAGHSCATVAGAYLATAKALLALYPNGELPVRGNVSVELTKAEDEGVTGVIGSVISIITGAKGEGGFKGIAGRYYRNNLMSYNVEGLKGEIRFSRTDNGKSVETIYRPAVPPAENTSDLIGAILSNSADRVQIDEFKEKWQSRVRNILLKHFDDDEQLIIL